MRARGNRPRELGAPGRNRGGQAPAPCGAGAIRHLRAAATGTGTNRRAAREGGVRRSVRTRRSRPRSHVYGPGIRGRGSLHPVRRPDLPVRRAHSLLPSPTARPDGRHSQVSLRHSLARDPSGRCDSGRKNGKRTSAPLIVRHPQSGACSPSEHRRTPRSHRRAQDFAALLGATGALKASPRPSEPPPHSTLRSADRPTDRPALSASPRRRARRPPRPAPPPRRCCPPAPRRATASR